LITDFFGGVQSLELTVGTMPLKKYAPNIQFQNRRVLKRVKKGAVKKVQKVESKTWDEVVPLAFLIGSGVVGLSLLL
jgi:hypothetical protein